MQAAQEDRQEWRSRASDTQSPLWLWKLASDATRKGGFKASWRPLYGKRPQWTCETSSEGARGLNDHNVSGARGTRTRRQCLAREKRRHETYKHGCGNQTAPSSGTPAAETGSGVEGGNHVRHTAARTQRVIQNQRCNIVML